MLAVTVAVAHGSRRACLCVHRHNNKKSMEQHLYSNVGGCRGGSAKYHGIYAWQATINNKIIHILMLPVTLFGTAMPISFNI